MPLRPTIRSHEGGNVMSKRKMRGARFCEGQRVVLLSQRDVAENGGVPPTATVVRVQRPQDSWLYQVQLDGSDRLLLRWEDSLTGLEV